MNWEMSDAFSECQKENWNGSCCCNCIHQVEVMKHPWNMDVGRGRISERLGFGCADLYYESDSPAQVRVVFYEGQHGMCEMWARRKDE